MSSLDKGVKLYLGEHESDGGDYRLPQGLVSVRSFRSPEKDTVNEDAAAVIALGDQALVLAVADGVGGMPAGREAANAAVRTLHSVLSAGGDVTRLRSSILDGMEEANRTVLEMNRGAATTLAVAEIGGGQLRCYHVGDSELIGVGQRGRVKLRVVPHSPTGFAVEAGLMDEEEAVQHDQRHVLFNVIGSPDMRIDVGASLKLAVKDTLLLATDGLMDNLFVDEIIEIIRAGPLPAAADRLVERARAQMTSGGANGPCKPDDLTVILYRPGGTGGPRSARRRAAQAQSRPPGGRSGSGRAG
jgi:serine/threonine protein phosphatase PrpC